MESEPDKSTAITTQQQLPTTQTQAQTQTRKSPKKLTLVPLIFLIYFEVAGGPYGEEPAVQAAGPLLALIGFSVFPFIWSVPEALITAELSTAFPGNGGFVIWAERAFGPFWGSLMGTWKFLSGVINIAAFPVLCVEYLQKLVPALSSGWPRYVSILGSTVLLSFLNYTGIAIVGYTAVALGLVSLSPFVLMSVLALPKIKPKRWLSMGDDKKDWNLYFNTLFWNLNFWDNVSTLAGEVERPRKNFPKALFWAVVFTCVSYLVPLFAVIGAVDVAQERWEIGFHAEAAKIIAGKWLQVWLEFGAVLSAIGLFEAQLSSSAYQVLGMAGTGFLPEAFARRSRRFGTPSIAILVSAALALGVSYMSFTVIVSSANFLYSLGMLLEFAAFVWLRRKMPGLKRPYRVPMGIPGVAAMCAVPSAFLIFVMAIATKTVFLVSGVMTVAGIGWFFLMRLCKSRKWLKFAEASVEDTYEEEEEEQEQEQRRPTTSTRIRSLTT